MPLIHIYHVRFGSQTLTNKQLGAQKWQFHSQKAEMLT